MPADPPTPPPGVAATGPAAVADLLSGFGAAVAGAFSAPMGAVAGALAQPWQQFGQQLASSWGGVAEALAAQYKTILTLQLQQFLGSLPQDAQDAINNGAAFLDTLVQWKENAEAVVGAGLAEIGNAIPTPAEVGNAIPFASTAPTTPGGKTPKRAAKAPPQGRSSLKSPAGPKPATKRTAAKGSAAKGRTPAKRATRPDRPGGPA